MTSNHKSWAYYLTRENKNDIRDSQSCFSLNLSELSTRTAIKNVNATVKGTHDKCLDVDEKLMRAKSKVQEIDHSERKYDRSKIREYPIKNCCNNYGDQVSDSYQQSAKLTSYSLSEFSTKTLPKSGRRPTTQKSQTKCTQEKVWEIERHNEYIMKKLLKAKPTADIKKSTSEMTLLQTRSEKHVSAASIQRRQKQYEINTLNSIIQKKLNAIATKRMSSV